MAVARTAARWRAASDRYSEHQQLLVGLWLFDVWDALGFCAMFEGEERRFVPRLLVGTCVADLKKRPLTVTDAFIVMDAKHGRTAAKYIGVAESYGLIARVRDPAGDKRKTVLLPTDALRKKFVDEMSRVADDARNFLAALLHERSSLPKTGAADFVLKPGRNELNRRIARIDASVAFPARNWSASYLSPK